MSEAMPVITSNGGLHETLALLTSHLHLDHSRQEDLVFLEDVFSEKTLGYLMKIHEKLRQYAKQSPSPVLHSASTLAEDLTEELQCRGLEEDERELVCLLSSPHLKAVLSAHDTVAQKNFDPVLPPLPEELDNGQEEEESVKIVRLVKNKEPLGATIRRDEVTGAVIVARIMRGGAADRSGLVHVGDELREVNGNLITHKRPDEISQILSQSQGSITLKIIPAVVEEDKLKESRIYLRALFDYVPFEDRATPCQEAGLPFKRGDILQVVSQEDATWWQAKRVGDCNLRAALIPSTHFQERRLGYRMKVGSFPSGSKSLIYDRAEDSDGEAVNGRETGEEEVCVSAQLVCASPPTHIGVVASCAVLMSSLSFRLMLFPKTEVTLACAHAFSWDFYSAGRRRSFRLRKDQNGGSPEVPRTDFLIYEEVTLYQPRCGERPRLIVLLGSLGARISELKQKVMADNPRQYGLAVPHTTRARKSHEREGVEYNFITKAAFEADIISGKFIEFGEYKENLYGTSLESIHKVLNQNKICLVDVQPEALKTLRTAQFKPYVIFVRPNVFEGHRKSPSSTSSLSVGVSEDELQEMKQSAERIDQNFGHWVDYVLVKEDAASAIAELQSVLGQVQVEPQWVPVSWVRT
ncbi:MAGUK p55 subfamily member 3-like [Synchiropus picturatus]